MTAPKHNLGQIEFVALMASLAAVVAFSLDAMLPALSDMAEALSPQAPNRVQLILSSFFLGMGLGTLVTGPLSDRFGRKPVVLVGSTIYIAAAIAGALAQSLEALVIARVIQGIGAAGPRVVALAIIRDLYSGREMARIMSFVMIVFTLVPAFAPTMGAGIIALVGWRGLFGAFVVFSLVTSLWLALRQPETLAVSARRPFSISQLSQGIVEVLRHPISNRAIAVQCFAFATLFLTLSTTQPIFDVTFDQGHVFHLWFGLIALMSASASFLNAALVSRLGMRFMVHTTFLVQLGLTGAFCISLSLPLPQPVALGIYIFWVTGLFFQAGLTIGNLNALAMEPMGHLAGLAASVIGSVATIGAVILAAPIGLAFDGTPRATAYGTLILVAIAAWLMSRLNRVPSPPAAAA